MYTVVETPDYLRDVKDAGLTARRTGRDRLAPRRSARVRRHRQRHGWREKATPGKSRQGQERWLPGSDILRWSRHAGVSTEAVCEEREGHLSKAERNAFGFAAALFPVLH